MLVNAVTIVRLVLFAAGPHSASVPAAGVGADLRTGFKPVSYGFRPRRRAQDAIAAKHVGTRTYHWVFEADIPACFDELAHSAIMERVRMRIVDKRVLVLIKAFLKAGIISGDRMVRESDTGTPQRGVLSSLLANIALTVLDAYFCAKWDAHLTSQRRDAHR